MKKLIFLFMFVVLSFANEDIRLSIVKEIYKSGDETEDFIRSYGSKNYQKALRIWEDIGEEMCSEIYIAHIGNGDCDNMRVDNIFLSSKNSVIVDASCGSFGTQDRLSARTEFLFDCKDRCELVDIIQDGYSHRRETTECIKDTLNSDY